MNLSKHKQGFTIVELLIVIVVIGILAAITIVAFNGVTKNAKSAAVKSDVANNVKLIESYKITNSEQYPATAAAASLKASSDNALSYIYNANSNTYCLQVQNSGITYASSGAGVMEGDCGAAGMIAWWKLNGDASDAIGSNAGTVTNASLTTGQNGSGNAAYSFNGSNTAIVTKSFDVTGSITVSAWVKPANGSQSSKIVAKHSGASNVQGTIADTSGNAQFEITAGGYYYSAYTTSAGQLPAGAWSLVTGVYDRSTAAIYVNGTLVASVPASGAIATNTLPWTIGALPSNTGNFNGSIDDARVYGRALTASEITMLYNKGRNKVRNKGFTIVELLIVIVVIGILAAITIVSFNGVTKKAAATAAQSELSQNAKIIMAGNAVSGQYSTAEVMNGTVTMKFDASKYKVVTYCATTSDFILAVQTKAGDTFYKKMSGAPVQDNAVDAFAPCSALGLAGAKTTYLNLPSPCATEGANNTCTFSGTATVAYGRADMGMFTSKANVDGSIGCNGSAFGSDPAYSYAKSCYVFPN